MQKTLYAFEALCWLLASLLAALALSSTFAADFPLRSRSLWWEAALLALAVLLFVLGAVRASRGRALLQPARAAPNGWHILRSLLRLLLLIGWAFTLLVAAAGFSA